MASSAVSKRYSAESFSRVSFSVEMFSLMNLILLGFQLKFYATVSQFRTFD